MKKMLAILIWLLCSYVNWGFTMGYFSHKFPAQNNVSPAGFFAVLGPLGLPVVLVMGYPWHWRVRPLTTEERWQAFNAEFSGLGRDYFERNYN